MMENIKLIALLFVCSLAGCSWLGWGGSAALEGARVVAVQTARAGAIASKYTYKGSRRAVTWTGRRTVEGTTATLEALNIMERPVPPAILERIPDELLLSLSSLRYLDPATDAQRIVISSRDTRWEGEVFLLAGENGLEFESSEASDLIVVTLSAAKDKETSCLASYTVFVEEDNSELGKIQFATSVAPGIGLYGYPGWYLSEPGVFVIKALEGHHRYRIEGDVPGERCFLLVACFLPRYYDSP